MGVTSILIGMGNEGNSGNHASATLRSGESVTSELFVADYETGLNVQIWKAYYDEMTVTIQSPVGETYVIPGMGPRAFRYRMQNTELLMYYGEPSPYSIYQEIYLDFIPVDFYLFPGLWKITVTAGRIIDGRFNMWLPVEGALNGSRFLNQMPYATLTIPSTSRKSISVGAYNAFNFSYASFSGRGYEDAGFVRKPDIAAPGVDITTALPGGTFGINSGTSFATPFVTGAAAMMMEWGDGVIMRLSWKKAHKQRNRKHTPILFLYSDTICLLNGNS